MGAGPSLDRLCSFSPLHVSPYPHPSTSLPVLYPHSFLQLHPALYLLTQPSSSQPTQNCICPCAVILPSPHPPPHLSPSESFLSSLSSFLSSLSSFLSSLSFLSTLSSLLYLSSLPSILSSPPSLSPLSSVSAVHHDIF